MCVEDCCNPGVPQHIGASTVSSSLKVLEWAHRNSTQLFEQNFLLASGPERIGALAASGCLGAAGSASLRLAMQNTLGFPLVHDEPVSSSVHQCSRRGYHGVLKKLLTQCSLEGQLQDGRLNAPDDFGFTCLDYAASARGTNMVALLAKFGATEFRHMQSPRAEVTASVERNSQKLPTAKQTLITALLTAEPALPADLSRLIISQHSSADILAAGGHL